MVGLGMAGVLMRVFGGDECALLTPSSYCLSGRATNTLLTIRKRATYTQVALWTMAGDVVGEMAGQVCGDDAACCPSRSNRFCGLEV